MSNGTNTTDSNATAVSRHLITLGLVVWATGTDLALLGIGYSVGYRVQGWLFLDQAALLLILAQPCVTVFLAIRMCKSTASRASAVAFTVAVLAIGLNVIWKPYMKGYRSGESRLVSTIGMESIARECLALTALVQSNPNVRVFGSLASDVVAHYPSLMRLRGTVEIMPGKDPESGLGVRVRYNRGLEYWFGLSPDSDDWILILPSFSKPHPVGFRIPRQP